MHYPLQITVLCTTLWILRGDVNAAKTGVSPEVLTSFAKNIASVLSSTLLGELRDSRENQTDLKQAGPLRKLLEAQSFHGDAIEAINAKFLGSTPDRPKRLATERRQSLDDGQRGFQNVYASDAPRYTKFYNPELYRFPVNRGPEIPRGEAIVGAVENANADDRGNAIDGDVNAAALHYADGYHQPSGFKYKPDLVHHPLPYPPTQYGPHNFHDQYDNRPTPGPSDQPSAVAGIEDEEANGNPQSARVLDNRPYNLNYHNPYRNPHHPPFNNHEIYPHGHPANGQPSSPGDDQDAQNPSALTEDQNQKGGYIYPSFHYGPFHHGFYGPYHHNGPHNDSNGGNNSGPHYHDRYYGGYDPYFGPYNQPHYHNYNGRPDQGNENGQNAVQAEGENGNNNNNGNNHGHNHNYGYHDHGPFYGGPYGKYPGFPVFPYKPFGHGFYDPIGPKFKVPFIDPFGPFPLVPYFPPGFYPGPYGPYGPHGQNGNNNNNNDKSEGNAEKKQTEAAAEAEALAEGQSKIIESLSSNQQPFPLLFPVSIKNTKPNCEECGLTIA
ncbi:uncharacterized protein LOC143208079 [Lasioglossum baleicum]|uniref:uncharacterized protein LOC143208079 n=1 Tax=Lasioglossum baleicum TaxID=434251 RepID=UPI003FCE4B10